MANFLSNVQYKGSPKLVAEAKTAHSSAKEGDSSQSSPSKANPGTPRGSVRSGGGLKGRSRGAQKQRAPRPPRRR